MPAARHGRVSSTWAVGSPSPVYGTDSDVPLMRPPMSSVSRRHFLGTGAAAAAGLSLGGVDSAEAHPLATRWRASRPTVIASANGIRGVARAYEMLAKGADPLDAAI